MVASGRAKRAYCMERGGQATDAGDVLSDGVVIAPRCRVISRTPGRLRQRATRREPFGTHRACESNSTPAARPASERASARRRARARLCARLCASAHQAPCATVCACDRPFVWPLLPAWRLLAPLQPRRRRRRRRRRCRSPFMCATTIHYYNSSPSSSSPSSSSSSSW